VDLGRLLREKDLYIEYGLSISWQRKMRRLGGGPPFLKIGKMVRYRRADVEAFLAAHLVETHDAGCGTK
jgi:hypothetical protein